MQKSTDGPFRFDPRDLISGPFIICPQCSQQSFGVSYIRGTEYARRCKRTECWHTETFPLWPLEKKIVYIDQFAISNMMKALNPSVKGHERTKLEPIWLDLFETLDHICKLQLVVCPDSEEHLKESLLSRFNEPLKRIYELLSDGVSFQRAEKIEQIQIGELAQQWIKGEKLECTTDPRSVTSPGLHDWSSRYNITINGARYDVDSMRAVRNEVDRATQEVFRYYQKE